MKPDSYNAPSYRRTRGFTLLEVLVALVIIGLGMVAVFDQLNQMLTTVARLRDKTFANWIAVDRITELQVTGEFPDVGDRTDEIEMARADWTYTIKVSQVPEMELRRVDVTVAYSDTPEDVLAEIAGFIAQPAQPGIAPGTTGPGATPPGQSQQNGDDGDDPGAPGKTDPGATSEASFGVGWELMPPDQEIPE